MQPFRRILLFLGILVVGLLVIGITKSNSNLQYINSLTKFREPDNRRLEGLVEEYRKEHDTIATLAKDVASIKQLLSGNDPNAAGRIDALQNELATLKEDVQNRQKGTTTGQNDIPKDALEHDDDTSTAEHLYSTVRVLCYVPVSDDTINVTVTHIINTWGKRCNKLLFFASDPHVDLGLPVVGLGVPDSGSYDLSQKMFKSYQYLYQHHLQDYDWFIKADTDTFLIMENLRYLLSDYKPSEAIYFGHRFKVKGYHGYMSGGAGYVMSREALRRFGTLGYKRKCAPRSGTEDWEFGVCMAMLHVSLGDARDKLGRSRFHCFRPDDHVHGHFPTWYYEFDKYGAKKGIDSVSDYAISFHFLEREELYMLEFYIYHLRPYGILAGLQKLNKDRSKTTTPKASEAPPHDEPRLEINNDTFEAIMLKFNPRTTRVPVKPLEELIQQEQ